MRKIGLALIMAVGLGAGAAQAAPAGVPGLGDAAGSLGLVEQAQFVISGRNYCFYDAGWHGPGWYWCGYRHRHGLGWGGERGWQGWERREWRSEGRHREERREGRRDRRENRKEIRTDRREDRKEMKTEKREDRKEMKSEKSNMGKTGKTAPSGNKDEAKDKK